MGRVVIDKRQVRDAYVRDVGPEWQRLVGDAGVDVIAEAAPIDTGRLVNSWTHSPYTDASGRPSIRFRSSAFYAPYVDKGTGVHGPRGQRIYPVRAKYLSWIDRSSGKRVFRSSVAGQIGQHYVAAGFRTIFDRVVDYQWY